MRLQNLEIRKISHSSSP